MAKEPPANIVAFLARIGATHTPHHAGRSLFDHLIATWQILKDWEQPDAVATGGLCHSLYGTDAFDSACLNTDDRKMVRDAIGDEAEQISFLFGAMMRDDFLENLNSLQIQDRFTNQRIPITADERSALCHILLANELDLVIAKKGAGRPDKVLKKVGPVFRKMELFLAMPAKAAFKNFSQIN